MRWAGRSLRLSAASEMDKGNGEILSISCLDDGGLWCWSFIYQSPLFDLCMITDSDMHWNAYDKALVSVAQTQTHVYNIKNIILKNDKQEENVFFSPVIN